MAVPAHDQRDHEFARKFGLPIVRGDPRPARGGDLRRQERPTTGEGTMVQQPAPSTGMPVAEAGEGAITADCSRASGVCGERGCSYRLRDWCISPPALLGPADPDDLLRRLRHRAGAGDGPPGRAARDRGLPARRAPGSRRWRAVESFYHVACPRCGGPARRETDVSRQLPRLGLVLPALSVDRPRRRARGTRS